VTVLAVARPDTTFLVHLQPGETWHPHPCGGVVIAHPDRGVDWVHEVDGQIVRESITCV
jgi:hypothetical protein